MEKTSLFYWLPKIKNPNLNMPKTECLKIPFEALYRLLDGEIEQFNVYKKAVFETAAKIGYPLFLRTDLCSGKHDWLNTCYVAQEKDLLQHIFNVVEANAMAGFMGLDFSGLVFREFIEIDWTFKAFRGLPIGKERRYFIQGGKVLCHHAYWTKEAFEKGYHHQDLPDNWEIELSKLNEEPQVEIEMLTRQAESVAIALTGYWSVDFCLGKNGLWYLIDLAEGNKSWHPDCEFKT